MLNANSLAAANGVGVKNVQFQQSAEVLERVNLIIATYDPLITGIADDQPVLVTSPEDTGDKFGFGFMAHRLAIASDKGARGVPTYIIPQAEAGGAVVSAGSVDFSVTTVVSGTYYLYTAGDLVAVAIPALTLAVATTADDIAILVAAAISADNNLPVTAVVNGVTTSQVDITAKSKGPWGDDISITENLGFGQELPGGVSTVIVAMAAGAGIPDIQDALETGLGTGDAANTLGVTGMVHGYGQDSSTLDKVSAYVGEGNDFVGLYAKTVARPFRSLVGDVAAGSGGLTAARALADSRRSDRANGVIPAPGSQSHPAEIAALMMGIMERINGNLAEQTYIDEVMDGVWPGSKADQWTADFDNRDLAVKGGVGTTLQKGDDLTAQNVISFYRPASVPVASNGYRSMRNISILQNVLSAIKLNFEQERWKGITIVADVNKVGNTTSKAKARDTGSVLNDLVALANAFQDRAWIFDASFTIDQLKLSGSVTIRAGGAGFDNILRIVLSGEGGILDTTVEFDASLAVFLN